MSKKLIGFNDPNIAQGLKRFALKTEPTHTESVKWDNIAFDDLRVYLIEVKETITAAKIDPQNGDTIGSGIAYIRQRDKTTENKTEYYYYPEDSDVKVEVDVYSYFQEEIPIGDIALAVQDRDGDLWIIPSETKPNPETTIVFQMKTDRTREQNASGLLIGRAQAVIEDKVGTEGENIGESVEIIFADSRWLGAISGCEGIADYIYDPKKAEEFGQNNPHFWIVKECQEKVAGFWFKTCEDRDPEKADQDIEVEVLQLVGHANADYYKNPDQGSGTTNDPEAGTATFRGIAHPGGEGGTAWELVSEDCAPGYKPNWRPLGFPAPIGETRTLACTLISGEPENPPNSEETTKTKVRFHGLTFPRMLKGAVGFASHDVDITNTTNNSTMHYYVVQCDQQALRISSVLGSPMCGTDASVEEVAAITFWPFSQTPLNITTIPNPHFHYGKAGDKIKASWNEATKKWEVDEVDKHPYEVALDIKTTEENGCYTIAGKKVMAALEICSNPSALTLLSYSVKDVTELTGLRLDKGEDEQTPEVCTPKFIADIKKYKGLTLCIDAVETTVEYDLTSKVQVIDVYDDGDCIIQTYVQEIGFGHCGEIQDENVFCTTDEQCEDSSSSTGQ